MGCLCWGLLQALGGLQGCSSASPGPRGSPSSWGPWPTCEKGERVSKPCLLRLRLRTGNCHVPLATVSSLAIWNIKGTGNVLCPLQGHVSEGGRGDLGTNPICRLNAADLGPSCRVREPPRPHGSLWGPQVLPTPYP